MLRVDNIVDSVVDRMLHGTKEHTPSSYLGWEQLIQRMQRMKKQIEKFKLNDINLTRKITRYGVKLDGYKRFASSIAASNYAGVGRLVSTCIKQKMGIGAITNQLYLAVNQVYAPKNFDEKSKHLAILLWKFGSARACRIAAKALNLPSLSTARRALVVPTIEVSPKFPTSETIERNIRAVFPPEEKLGDEECWNIQADEIKAEERPRYEPRQNAIIGMCREHVGSFETEVHSAQDIDTLIEGVKSDEVHVAQEVRKFSMKYGILLTLYRQPLLGFRLSPKTHVVIPFGLF
jgi:hypothetical protein